MSNDKDKLAEYYESAEANQDSRSDAWVAFIIIVVFVVTAVFFLCFVSVAILTRTFQHQALPYNQNLLR